MSAPPQIRVKRKRNEEPVESLYLESANKRRPGSNFLYRRVVDKVNTQAPDQGPLIPLIIPTLPGHEDDVLHNPQTAQSDSESAQRKLPINRAKYLSGTYGSVEPRRFYLSRLNDIEEYEDGSRKRKLATFIEKRQPQQTADALDHDQDYIMAEGDRAPELARAENTEMSAGQPLRKKPTSAARRGKEATLLRSTETSEPENDLGLALQKFAAEQFRGLQEDHSFKSQLLRNLDHPLRDQVSNAHDRGEDKMDTTEEEGYVEEIYIRHSNFKLSSSMDTFADGGKGVGYLVINEEDQPFWEDCALDGIQKDWDSDQDWDSEQDDENAENYYGADYPEEEVDSDDELGYNTYKHRYKGTSDDEKFDSDSDAFSNAEYKDRYPWREPFIQKPTDSGNSCEDSE